MRKKLFTLMMLLVAVCSGAWAADPDLENDYTLVRTATFGDGTEIAGTVACAYTAYETGNKRQQGLTIATAPESAAGWIAFQGWKISSDKKSKGWWNGEGEGLYCVNAPRSAAVFGDDLTTGWLVIFQCTGQATAGLTLTNANGDPDGTFTYVASEDGTAYICTITAESDAYVGFCGIKNSKGIASISVYKPNKVITAATYTVQYKDTEGNTLKDAAIYDSFAGAEITLTASDKANITKDDVVYAYASDDSADKTVAEDNSTVVTVTFDVAPTYTCTVTDNLGNQLAKETVAKGENFTFYVPYYAFKDGKFYQSPSLSSGSLSYGKCTISAIAAETNITVTYTEEENTNVVFFSEAENLDGVTGCDDQYTQIRMSNGKAGYFANQTAIVNLPAGIYTITASTRAGSTTFYAGEKEVLALSSTGAVVTTTSDAFTLYEATDINVSAGKSNAYFDYVIIRKTGDATVTATVGATGWATFASDYALTVEEADGAYAVTAVNKDALVVTPITGNVAAGTPMLLKGEGEKTFDVVASGNAVASNLLVRGTGEDVTEGYVLVARDGAAVFAPIGETAAAVAKDKAYLVTNVEAPVLYIEGMTTGISAVENAKVADGQIYNLAGQRVAKAQKGLYIVNGKKFIVK